MAEGNFGEKCAVAAVVASNGQNVAPLLYESLFAMQHRGAEASGIVTDGGASDFNEHRDAGLVRDVYDVENMKRLSGDVGIGHNRYSTNGSRTSHLQPYVDGEFGFAHNGNLPVVGPLKRYLREQGVNAHDLNDSEMMGAALAARIKDGRSLPDAVEDTQEFFTGAYSCVATHDGLTVAFRDTRGIRPLAIGKFEGGRIITSETCGLDIIGAEYERDVNPGEMVIVSRDGIESKRLGEADPRFDVFEWVYFARHDSTFYDQRVSEVRRRFGAELAGQHPITDQDTIVIPIPDTSVPAAEGYADKLILPHAQGIIKNRYIGRTFMKPNQGGRMSDLRRKHNVIPEVVKGKNVVLIDDSIVRGNTSPRLVEQVRACGAKAVHLLIASPPVMFPDFYGIDTPQQSELLAANRTLDQMREYIGCDYLGFLSLEGMVRATGMRYNQLNLSCFTGEYSISIGRHQRSINIPVNAVQ